MAKDELEKKDIASRFKRDIPLGLFVIGLTYFLGEAGSNMNKYLETTLQVIASAGFGVLVYDTIVLAKKINAQRKKGNKS